MKTSIALAVLALIVIAGIGSGTAQAPADRVVKLDPALDALISVDAKIEKVASGFGFTEGPVWVQRGLPTEKCPSTKTRAATAVRGTAGRC